MPKHRKHAIFAVVFAVLAGASSYLYLAGVGADAGQEVSSSRRVVVAKQDIAQGESVTRAMVELKECGGAVGRLAIDSMDAVVNKTASSPIYQGEPILASRLSSSDRGSEASYLIADGKVAIALPADPVSAVGNGIRPGDTVDILVTTEKALAGQDETRFLCAGIKVIGVGGTYPFGETKGGGLIGGVSSNGSDAIVVEANPDQARQLTHFSERAKLKFALKAKELR